MTDTIEVVVRLTISEEDFDVNRLEERVRAARTEAGRALFLRALAWLEAQALANHPGAVCQRRRQRELDTTLGHVAFERWHVRCGAKTTCLLDRLLGLARHSRVSPAVKKRASELASQMTSREAAAVLSQESGTPLSAQSVHRWVQEVGLQVAERELASGGVVTSPREVVVTEIDDTAVHSQEKGERKFFLKLALGYSQKRRLGPKRWALADKLVYGGVEEPEAFAERFYVRVEDQFGVAQARHVVVKGDGAEWIRQVAAQVFPGHVFQLDRWHLLDRITQFAGHLPRLWKRLTRWVYAGRLGALARALRHLVGAEARREQARQELLGYVTTHAAAITAVDRLRPQVSPAARALLTHGTGAMEKNIEIFIGRRFKRWGMRWTRRGAHHLLKLRLWIFRFGEKCFEALNSSETRLSNA